MNKGSPCSMRKGWPSSVLGLASKVFFLLSRPCVASDCQRILTIGVGLPKNIINECVDIKYQYRVQSPEYRIQSPAYRVQSPEYIVLILILSLAFALVVILLFVLVLILVLI